MLEFNVVKNKHGYNYVIILEKYYNPSISILIDTGSLYPVWTSDESAFLDLFPDARLANNLTCMLGGFGNGTESCKIYILPKFILSDGKESIIYHNLPVVMQKKNFSFDMIISSTMLNKMNYKYVSHTRDKKEINPVFRIYNLKQDYYAGIHKITLQPNTNICINTHYVLSNVYTFTHE